MEPMEESPVSVSTPAATLAKGSLAEILDRLSETIRAQSGAIEQQSEIIRQQSEAIATLNRRMGIMEAKVVDATSILLYPMLMLKLNQHPLLEKFDTSSLTKLMVAGGTVTGHLMESVVKKLKLKGIIQAPSAARLHHPSGNKEKGPHPMVRQPDRRWSVVGLGCETQTGMCRALQRPASIDGGGPTRSGYPPASSVLDSRATPRKFPESGLGGRRGQPYGSPQDGYPNNEQQGQR
ncbi:hypothetical protein HPB50_027277 [Hyalomma asiaticum]|uniref:Uncharacterized protein n=1 Tax=Hyalomma asiaticum TaxID=266040 RepID=A0ACB7TSB3_HYAAI|nr:hypothetical protein HPB50_027277 [Hyalomma asiaticum]